MLKLSVILPTHNVELFIENCIRSVENQDIDRDEYELIVVDDGATDGSSERVLHLQKEYSNITLIRQQNAGLSAARNRGMLAAKGRYLLFVDTDDRLENNCFATMLGVADSHPEIDFVGFNYRIHFNSGLVVTPRWPAAERHTIGGVEFYRKFVLGDYHIWRYLFSREFLIRSDLFFLEGISFEDAELTPRLMCMAKNAIFYDLPFYHYYLRPGSLSTSRSKKHISSRLLAAANLNRFMLERAADVGLDARVMFGELIAESLLSSVSASHRFPGLLGDLSRRIRRLPFYPLDPAESGRHRREVRILNRSVILYWSYSHILSLFNNLRYKVRMAAAIARGPSAVKKFTDYFLRAFRPS